MSAYRNVAFERIVRHSYKAQIDPRRPGDLVIGRIRLCGKTGLRTHIAGDPIPLKETF